MKKYIVTALAASTLVNGTVIASEALQIELTQSGTVGTSPLPSRAAVGDVVMVRMQAVNLGSVPGTGTVVRYEWPRELELLDIDSNPAAAVIFRVGASRLDWHIGDLPADAERPAKLALTARVSAGSEGKLLDGELRLIQSDQEAKVSTGPAAAIAVAGMADVDLQISSDGSFSQAGAFYNVSFMIDITNNGPETATNVSLQVTIDNFTLSEIEDGGFNAVPSGVTCDDTVLACALGDIAANETVNIVLAGRVSVDSAPINVPVQLDVSTSDIDNNLSNNIVNDVVSLPEVEEESGGGGAASWLLLVAGLTGLFRRRRARAVKNVGK